LRTVGPQLQVDAGQAVAEQCIEEAVDALDFRSGPVEPVVGVAKPAQANIQSAMLRIIMRGDQLEITRQEVAQLPGDLIIIGMRLNQPKQTVIMSIICALSDLLAMSPAKMVR
jgi:hypothetical protein